MSLEILPFLLKEKGIRATCNYFYWRIFYNTRNPFFIKVLQWFTPYPFYIEIETTTRCNLRCIMCEHTYWDEKGRDMSFEDFKMIVDQFPDLKWIGLTGIGESFLQKDFLDMLRYVKKKPVIIELFDPFHRLDEDIAKELINIGIEEMYVSMDAATKETYEKIRIGASFEKVIENIKSFVEIKAKKGTYFPILDFHYIISKVNIHEITQYIELVHSLSPGSKILFTILLHEFEETKDLFVEVSDEIGQQAAQKATELGIKIYWNVNVSLNKPHISKCTTWSMPFIFVTGHVVPCCSSNEANRREFQKEHSLGNVFENSFRQIWYSKKYKDFRRMIRRGQVPEPCKNCCIYNVGKKESL